MLFMNKRTGNILSATNKTSIAMMQASENYTEYKATPKPAKNGRKKKKGVVQKLFQWGFGMQLFHNICSPSLR